MAKAAKLQSSFGWWVLLTSTLSLAFSPGPMIFGSLGLFAPYLATEFAWSRGEIMLALTLFNIGGFLAAPYTGRLIDRLGARTVILPSLLFLTAGFVALSYFASNLPTYYGIALAWGLLTVGSQSISYARLLVGWFPERRGMAIGVAAAGLGLGFMVAPLIVHGLLEVLPWRQAMVAFSGIVIVGPLLLNLAFAHPNPEEAADRKGPSLEGASLIEARRTQAFWLVAVAISLMASVLAGIVPHLVGIANDAGLTPRTATILASLYGAATLIGRLVVGMLVDRFPVARVGMVFFGLAAAGFALLSLASTGAGGTPLLVAAALTIGAGFGAESDLIAIFISRYFGQRAFGAIYGWFLSAFILGSAAGPAILGFGRDAFGGYRGLMIYAAVVSVISVILVARLRKLPETQEDEMLRGPKRAVATA
ncbi:MAG: MFS transporter [Steroidobacteraceae bacterium]